MKKMFRVVIQEVHPETGEYLESEDDQILHTEAVLIQTMDYDGEDLKVESHAYNASLGPTKKPDLDNVIKVANISKRDQENIRDIFRDLISDIEFDQSKN